MDAWLEIGDQLGITTPALSSLRLAIFQRHDSIALCSDASYIYDTTRYRQKNFFWRKTKFLCWVTLFLETSVETDGLLIWSRRARRRCMRLFSKNNV